METNAAASPMNTKLLKPRAGRQKQNAQRNTIRRGHTIPVAEVGSEQRVQPSLRQSSVCRHHEVTLEAGVGREKVTLAHDIYAIWRAELGTARMRGTSVLRRGAHSIRGETATHRSCDTSRTANRRRNKNSVKITREFDTAETCIPGQPGAYQTACRRAPEVFHSAPTTPVVSTGVRL